MRLQTPSIHHSRGSWVFLCDTVDSGMFDRIDLGFPQKKAGKCYTNGVIVDKAVA